MIILRWIRITLAVLAVAVLLAVTACGSSTPNKYDVDACRGLKTTTAKLPNGTAGNVGTMDTVALLGWRAIARDSKLKSDITSLMESLALIGSAYSQTAYDSEDAAVRAIGSICAGDDVNGIANGW